MIPMKVASKLVGSVILGGFILSLINLIGSYASFHINVNILSSCIAGLLGIPGIILLIALKLMFKI